MCANHFVPYAGIYFYTKLDKIKPQMGRKYFNMYHEIVWKTLSVTNKRKNREEIHQTQGKCPWKTWTLSVFYFFSGTEFLPCFFSSWIYSPPPGGGVLLAKIFTLGFRWRETIVILYGHKKRDSTLDEPWEKYHLLRRSVRWLSSRWKCPTRFFLSEWWFFLYRGAAFFFPEMSLKHF